jgi:hypothetical protein
MERVHIQTQQAKEEKKPEDEPIKTQYRKKE